MTHRITILLMGSPLVLHSSYVDTATSLGGSAMGAVQHITIGIYNGGRVVKWVDSSGTIKTSVLQ